MSGVKGMLWAGLWLAATVTMTLSPSFATVSKGDKAPDFSLGSVDGKSTVQLSNSTTEPTLLVFWVSWCPHCQREMPLIENIYHDLGSKGMNIVGVSVDRDQDEAKGFVKDYKLTFSNAYAGTDKGSAVLETYGVAGVPMIYVIGKDSVIKATFAGETEEKPIRDEIAKLGVK